MLQRPSLLLNPWTTSETNTKEVKLSEGDGWVGAPPASAAPEGRMEKLKAYGGSADSSYRKGFVCFDFLPESEAVFANLRPGKNGMVEVAFGGCDGRAFH